MVFKVLLYSVKNPFTLSVACYNNIKSYHTSELVCGVIGQFCRPYFTVWPAQMKVVPFPQLPD